MNKIESTHISMNPHYNNLPDNVKDIERFVFLKKELNYFIAKRRYIEETLAFSVNEELNSELKLTIQELEKNIREVEMQIPEQIVQDLKFVIKAYMDVYRLTVKEVANQSGVTNQTVKDALKNGFLSIESKKFAIWAIRTFRLDANLYLHHIHT